MSFIITEGLRKLARMTGRIKVVQGGTSAAKTYGILAILIDRATCTPGLEISVVSESYPHLRRGAIKDFLKIMKSTGRLQSGWNKTIATYTFANGSYIEFFSADEEARLRGARRHILYINEANNINFEAYHQLAIRTSVEVWIDFNPTAEFWAHTETLQDDDAELLILTYLDNEALSKELVREIEKAREKAKNSAYWANWWKVYGMGQVGALQGAIFDNWTTKDNIPEDARYIGSGLDFGYTNDPTALIDVYQYQDLLYLDEVVYQTGLTNQQIATLCHSDDLRRKVIADSAEPKSIDAIYMAGVNIRGTLKGRDSIAYGIDLLQQQNLVVTKRSTNLIKELRNYVWDTDKAGKSLNKPIGIYNHGIDAVRYWAMNHYGVGAKADIR